MGIILGEEYPVGLGGFSNRSVINNTKYISHVELAVDIVNNANTLYIESIWIFFNSSSSANMKGVIYSYLGDDNPGSLLVAGTEVSGLKSGWIEFPINSNIPLALNYYIGFISESSINYMRCFYSAYISSLYNDDTYSDGPSDPFGVPSITNYVICAYATGYFTGYIGFVSKTNSYAVLSTGGNFNVSKSVAYAVLQTPKTNIPQVSIIV